MRVILRMAFFCALGAWTSICVRETWQRYTIINLYKENEWCVTSKLAYVPFTDYNVEPCK